MTDSYVLTGRALGGSDQKRVVPNRTQMGVSIGSSGLVLRGASETKIADSNSDGFYLPGWSQCANFKMTANIDFWPPGNAARSSFSKCCRGS